MSYFGKRYYVNGFSKALMLIRTTSDKEAIVFDGNKNYQVPIKDIVLTTVFVEDASQKKCSRCLKTKDIECFKQFKQSTRRSKNCKECLNNIKNKSLACKMESL